MPTRLLLIWLLILSLALPAVAQLKEAEQAYQQHNYAEALDAYRKAFAKTPTPDIRLQILRTLLKLKRWDDFSPELTAAIAAVSEPLARARILHLGAMAYQEIPHSGFKRDGVIYRSNEHREGEQVWLYQEDRDQSQAWFSAARKLYEQLLTAKPANSAAQQSLWRELIAFNTDLSSFWLQQFWIPYEAKDWPRLEPLARYPYAWADDTQVLIKVYQLYQENVWLARQLKDSHREALERYRWARILLERRGMDATEYPDQDPLKLLQAILVDYPSDAYAPEIRLLIGELHASRGNYSAALESWQMLRGTRLNDHAEAAIQELTWPRLGLSTPGAQPPETAARFAIQGRNLEQVKFKLHSVPLETVLQNPLNLYKPGRGFADYVQNLGGSFKEFAQVTKPVAEWDFTPKPDKAYAPFSADLTLPKPVPAGAYLLEAHSPKVRAAILIILSDVVMSSRQDNQRVIYYLAEAVSGRPVPGAQVYVKETTGYSPNQQVRAYRGASDAQGMYSFNTQAGQRGSEQRQFEAFAAWKGHYALSGMGYWSGYQQQYQSLRIYSYTDRPLYRPGQTVNFRQLLRRYEDGKYLNGDAMPPVEVRVTNPRGEEVYKQTLKPNRFGSLNGSFELAADAALGAYSLQFHLPDSSLSVQTYGSASFQVEEYKKPEYEVKVNPQPALPGAEAKATIEASYFFGGPVAGAQVQYTVSRRQYWPWWGDYDYFWEPRPYDGQQVVAQSTGTTDAQGKLEIRFPTAADTDSVYTISAQVTDASRREVSGAGSLTVTRQAFFANIRLDQGFYQTGDRLSAEIGLLDPNGKPMARQAGTVSVERIKSQPADKNEAQTVTETVYTQPVSSDAEGRIFVRWQADLGGKYRLRFAARDKREMPVTAFQEFWVAGPGFEGQTIRLNGVELVTDKRQYAPGETVEVLVQTDQPDSHVWLTQETDNAILRSDLLALRGRSQIQRFSLKDEHQPNFMLRALSVRDRALHSDQRELFVPALQHKLEIGITPDKSAYEPGSKGRVRLKVLDRAGRPVESELSLAMVDASLYQLLPDSTQAIHDAFYGQRRSLPQRLNTSLNVHFGGYVDYLVKQKEFRLKEPFSPLPGQPGVRDRYRKEAGADGEMPAPSPALAQEATPEAAKSRSDDQFAVMDANAAPGGTPPRVRGEFRDTAYWNPLIVTNASGEAELSLDFPDNLTTWRLLSRGWNAASGVGQAQTEVKTRQDLMLRLQHPRFLTETDEVVVSANVNNDLASAEAVTVTLQADASHLQATGPLSQKISVPAKGQARVDWRFKVIGTGESVLTAEARGSKAGDAVRQSLPIQVYGSLRTETRSGSTRANAAETLRLPAERKPEQTKLSVTLQPSLAAAMLDALPYLAEYPYGCIEQTTSRFVPAVLVAKTLQDLGVSLDDLGKQLDTSQKALRIKQPLADKAQLQAMIDEGLRRIASGQNPDGGWGWWSGGQSDPYMSSYVLDALMLAAEADLKLNQAMLDKGLSYLLTAFKDEDSLHLKAYQAYVLARAKKLSASELKGLFAQRDELNSYSKALLAMASHYAGASEQARLILQNMKSFVRREAMTGTASWDNASSWWYWYGDRVETNAVILQAFNLVSPQDALVPEIMRWLVYNREGNRWHSTKDTARALYALSGYLRNTRELKADYSVEVRLNGKPVQTVKFTPDKALAGPVRIELADKDLSVGENRIELVKTGEGSLYYSAALQVFSREAKIAAAGNRLEVKRSYFKVEDRIDPKTQKIAPQRTPLGEGALLTSGEEVEVRLEVKAPNDYEYLLFEDFKPAGFEAVETLSGYDWQNGTGVYKEYRDNRVAMFLGWMPQGTQVMTYRLRAEVPGIFHALPLRAEAMYAPQIQASSDSMTLGVKD